jgi:D-alanyl-D-alanine dipeptidase
VTHRTYRSATLGFGTRFAPIAAAAFLASIRVVTAASLPTDDLVEINSVDPTILIELRYAISRNFLGQPLYPRHARAYVRPSVAERLARAQRFLREHGYGLKVWDAYRPQAAQYELWRAQHNQSYVADPGEGNGSLHTWGVAVDATLVDSKGREVAMPTDFDEFTPAAMLRYQGQDPVVKWHLKVLQVAMRRGGFYGMRTEWWHFVSYDWKKYGPIRDWPEPQR